MVHWEHIMDGGGEKKQTWILALMELLERRESMLRIPVMVRLQFYIRW